MIQALLYKSIQKVKVRCSLDCILSSFGVMSSPRFQQKWHQSEIIEVWEEEMANNKSLTSPWLSNDNYIKWYICMRAYPGSQELWDLMKRGFEFQNEVSLSQAQIDLPQATKRKDQKALTVIH